jgi:hypothetical protein
MSRATHVRYQTTAEAADENQRLVQQVYAELNASKPDGLRYLTLRLADGVTFVHISFVEGEENPLLATAAFQEFSGGLPQRVAVPPKSESVTLVGSYGI